MKHILKYNNINESDGRVVTNTGTLNILPMSVQDESILMQSIEDTFSDIKEIYGMKIYKDYLNINRFTKTLNSIIIQINFKIKDNFTGVQGKTDNWDNGSDGHINTTNIQILDIEMESSNYRIEFLKKVKTCMKNIDENLFSFNKMKIHKSFSKEIYEIYFNVKNNI